MASTSAERNVYYLRGVSLTTAQVPGKRQVDEGQTCVAVWSTLQPTERERKVELKKTKYPPHSHKLIPAGRLTFA